MCIYISIYTYVHVYIHDMFPSFHGFSEFASAPFEPQASIPARKLHKLLQKKSHQISRKLWEFLATMKRTLEIAPCARILHLHITHGNMIRFPLQVVPRVWFDQVILKRAPRCSTNLFLKTMIGDMYVYTSIFIYRTHTSHQHSNKKSML